MDAHLTLMVSKIQDNKKFPSRYTKAAVINLKTYHLQGKDCAHYSIPVLAALALHHIGFPPCPLGFLGGLLSYISRFASDVHARSL